MAKQNIDYEFSMDNIDEFEINFTLVTTNKQFKEVFAKAVKALRKKKVVDVDKDTDISHVKEITIDPRHYGIMKRYFIKIVLDIERDCMKIEKIKFIAWVLDKVTATRRDDGNWDLKTYIKGNYVYL